MKSTGIVRKTDELGRIVIPKELRRTLDINEGDGLEIFSDDDKIILRKYTPGCSNCNDSEIYKTLGGIRLCRRCCEVLMGAQ